MLHFFVRRVLLGVLVLIGLSVLTFIITRVAPGDPAALWVGPRASVAQIERATVTLGLNRPLPVQYAIYMDDLAHGNLGRSFSSGLSVSHLLALSFPPTLELAIAS